MSVYKLTCNETGKVYYGSTKQTLELRKRVGWKRCSCKDFINPTIELVETVDDLDNLRQREDYYIRNFECVNKHRAMITDEEKDAYQHEYWEKNREKVRARRKAHREKNRERINARKRELYDKNRDKVSVQKKEYRKNNLEKLRAIEKNYRDKNKEKILARKRELYHKNRDKILAKRRERRRLKKLKEQENVK